MSVTQQRWLIIAGVAALVGLVLWSLSTVPGAPGAQITRAAALLGYSTLFLAILSSEYQRPMRRVFGRQYQTVHHRLSYVGLALIVIHPVSYALRAEGLGAFVPILSPWAAFLMWAGRPALYLFALAFATAFIYRRRRNVWKPLHHLNYVAFGLALIHGIRMGANAASGPLRGLWIAMGVVAGAVWLHRRILASRGPNARNNSDRR